MSTYVVCLCSGGGWGDRQSTGDFISGQEKHEKKKAEYHSILQRHAIISGLRIIEK